MLISQLLFGASKCLVFYSYVCCIILILSCHDHKRYFRYGMGFEKLVIDNDGLYFPRYIKYNNQKMYDAWLMIVRSTVITWILSLSV